MSIKNAYAQKLSLSDVLRRPIFHSVIKMLSIPSGSRGLDVGCGIGSHTCMLAKAVGSTGHVTGIDLSPELLAHARKNATEEDVAHQVSFQEGDMNELPFENNTFDWVWSVDCAGYTPSDSLSLVKELARVVKPGGSLSILAWSSQQLLPGYPQLEAKLNGTASGTAPFAVGNKPESHFLNTLGGFRKAGLRDAMAHTFVADVQSPLSDDTRNSLISLFEMRWGNPLSELSQRDAAEYHRLCLPESPDFILNSKDYYAFYTYTLFYGTVDK